MATKSFLKQGLSEPEFYGDLVYKSTYDKVHDPLPTLQHHLLKTHPFMLLQPDSTAITVTSKNIPALKTRNI